jgi:hypothetical protein
MADLARIKNNVRKMVDLGAPEADIDAYIAEEGVTIDDVRSFRSGGHQNVPEFRPVGVEGYDPESGEVEGRQPTALDPAGAFALAGPEGVPIIGPALNAAVRGGAAALVTPFSDKPFLENYEDMGRIQEDVQEKNPISTTAGHVTGAVAGTLPAMAAAPAAFGMGSGGLPARMAVSGFTGGGIGATDAAIRSQGDPDAMLEGGLGGLAAGAAGPAVGQAAGAGYRLATQWFADRGIRNVADLAPAAVKRIAQVAKADGLDPAAIRQRLADLGAEARLFDLGPNLQQEAGRLVIEPGPAQTLITGALRTREAAANPRIAQALDENFGRAPIPSRVDASIRANQKALSPEYEAVLDGAKRVETQPIADALDSMAANAKGEALGAIKNVRNMLNINGTDALDPNPRALLATRQAIDDLMENAAGNTKRILGVIRQQVDDTLSVSAPGIKEVDAKFAELARQRNALERGQDVLGTGKTAIRPQELADEAAEAALPQGALIGPSGAALRLREGARADIDRIVDTNRNDRAALARAVGVDGDWNKAKLQILFGDEPTERMMKILDAERVFAETNRIATGNSLSGSRMAARAANEPDPGLGVRDGFIAGGPKGAARAYALRLVDALGKRSEQARKQAADAAVATGLTRQNNERLIDALGLLDRRKAYSPAVSKVAHALLMSSALGGAR